jgi:hypothetical protein
MGKGDLIKIRGGTMDPEGEGSTKAGMICGIISCTITAVTLVIFILLIFVGGGLAALSN